MAPSNPATAYPTGDRRGAAASSAGSSAIGGNGTAVAAPAGATRGALTSGGVIAAVTIGHGVPDEAWADASRGGTVTVAVAITSVPAMAASQRVMRRASP